MSNLAKTDSPSSSDWAVMREQAQVLVASKLLPRAVDTPEKAIAIIQTGRELGLGPMQALRSIHIIEGKPTMAAELMAALALSRLPGSLLRIASTTNEECAVEAARVGQQSTTFRFSISDARAANLLGKDNWKKYPAAMLRARCVAAAARAVFPDAVLGLYDPDELGAVTSERGDVLTVDAHIEEPRQLGAINPHDQEGDSADGDPEIYEKLRGELASVDISVEVCDTYQKALTLRAVVGYKGGDKQTDWQQRYRYAYDSLNGAQRKEIGRLWNRCDRQLAKLEEKLKPGVEASFVDPPDDAEDFPRE
jgi:hypothetical protein